MYTVSKELKIRISIWPMYIIILCVIKYNLVYLVVYNSFITVYNSYIFCINEEIIFFKMQLSHTIHF